MNKATDLGEDKKGGGSYRSHFMMIFPSLSLSPFSLLSFPPLRYLILKASFPIYFIPSMLCRCDKHILKQ